MEKKHKSQEYKNLRPFGALFLDGKYNESGGEKEGARGNHMGAPWDAAHYYLYSWEIQYHMKPLHQRAYPHHLPQAPSDFGIRAAIPVT